MVDFTKHALVRMSQRALTLEEVIYIINHGEYLYRAGAIFIYLRKRDIPAWDRLDEHWVRLAGTAVVLTDDERMVITVWRNKRDGLKHIKRKTKYELKSSQLSRSYQHTH